MTKRRAALVSLAGMLWAAATFGSCELFMYTLDPPQNPYDPNNPVPPVAGFVATATDETTIQLTWTADWGESVEPPTGMIVIRKKGDPPAHRYDGKPIGWDESTQTSLVSPTDGTYTDAGLEAGSQYWYAVWTHDAAASHFTGPLYANATPQQEEPDGL